MATNTSQVGVILMTYGSPATLDDIPTYLKNIRVATLHQGIGGCCTTNDGMRVVCILSL